MGLISAKSSEGWVAMGVNDRGESGSHPTDMGHRGNINAFITYPATYMRLIGRLVASTMLRFGTLSFLSCVMAVGDERARSLISATEEFGNWYVTSLEKKNLEEKKKMYCDNCQLTS